MKLIDKTASNSVVPLMGALYLKPLDDAVVETGLFYARFMDDWLIIAPNRWKLKKRFAWSTRY